MSKKHRPKKEEVGLTDNKDKSPKVWQEESLKWKMNIRQRDDYTEKQKVILETMDHKTTRCVIIDGLWGTGKAQPLDSKILTPTGWKNMGEIKEGDYVFAKNGKPTKVLGVYPQGIKKIFKVVFSDNSETECCEDHLWLTQTEYERNKHLRKRNGGNPIYTKTPLPAKIRTTKEIKETILVGTHLNHSIDMVSPIEFEEKKHIIPPYILGVLLGDGCLRSGVDFTSEDEEIAKKVESLLPENLKLVSSETKGKAKNYGIVRKDGGLGMYCPNIFKDELKRLGVYGKMSYEKHVPQEYLFDSIENRLEILRGLMDTDGTVSKNYTSFTTTSYELGKGLEFLVRSFGGTTIWNERVPTYIHKGVKLEGRLAYTLSVKLNNNINPFYLSRKANRVIPKTKYFTKRYIKAIYPVGEKEAQCIMVEDADHLYITDDFILTHNTTLAVLGALKLLNSGRIKKILYVRSPCESSTTATVGILPGSLEERMAAYNAIMMDKLQEMLPAAESKKLLEEGHIEFIPPGLIRGRSFNATAIIVDECSQLSWEDLLLLVSRAGEFTRIFFVGDNFQKDIRNSGFRKFFDTFDDIDSKEHGIYTFELKDKSDIVRSGFLRYVMEKVGTLKYSDTTIKQTGREPMFPS